MNLTSQESGGNTVGSSCANLYTCDDYMAPQHTDNDQDMSVCMQLGKDCAKDEYNFSYTEWGVYIVTQERCIWYVLSATYPDICAILSNSKL